MHSNSLYETIEHIHIAFVHPVLDSLSVFTFLAPSSNFTSLGLLGLLTWIMQKVLCVIQLGMGLVIHEKFHMDVDDHVVRHYPILLLEQAHMFLPITVAHVWLETGTEVC